MRVFNSVFNYESWVGSVYFATSLCNRAEKKLKEMLSLDREAQGDPLLRGEGVCL